ncbi:hypothetical protein GN958_ATG20286 [Phytophthora infestans]|uniref:Uncharacterized protein n=1 Tax=Phytophthora infestans TaxID=4787 RepID=A0A8S9TUS9_PHYIN|nr:hypothetical protein GN958_ATG20286 [Phytophthora infestans]
MDLRSNVSPGSARGPPPAGAASADGARCGGRTRISPHSARVSPYPERIRTPTETTPPHPGPIRRRTPPDREALPATTTRAYSTPGPVSSAAQRASLLGAARSPGESAQARPSPAPGTARQPRTPRSTRRRTLPRAASPVGQPEQQIPASPADATSHQYQLVAQPKLQLVSFD